MRLIDEALQKVKLNKDSVRWSSVPNRLTCVIVEPRNHPNMRGTLYNMANVYANLDVGLTIYHSKENLKLIRDIIMNWEGVQLICLEKNNLTKSEYSHLLTTPSFYESVKSSHLLVFQTDSCIFKTIPDEYFEYDYVGAGWIKKWGNGCGNGGFSLRNKKAMINACGHKNYRRHPEDIYFAHADQLKPPNKELQLAFSVELIDHPDPIGCHLRMRPHLYSKLLESNQ